MTEEEQLMVPLDEYLKAGLHIGTKFRTKYMAPFIYKVRPDGLAVLNIKEIDKRIEIASKFISRYEPNEILLVCRRENGWNALGLFAKVTGIKAYLGRYPPGIMTNPELKNFTEMKLVIVCDPWPDKNVVDDASRTGTAVLALCDTNNTSNNIDLLIPCNNKGKKSIGIIFYILAREYLKSRGKTLDIAIEEFTKED